MAQGGKNRSAHPSLEADELQLEFQVSEGEALMAKKGLQIKRADPVKHMKSLRRRGLNAVSPSLTGFVAGSNVRIRHRP